MLTKISVRNFATASIHNFIPKKVDFSSFHSILPNQFINRSSVNKTFERFFSQTNSKTKIDMLKEKADLGDPEAEYELGSYYLSPNTNGKVDNEKGVHYIKLAAQHNHPTACYMYSMYLKNGFHVKKDLDQALKYLTYAADHKLEVAQFELALEYYTGKRYPSDMDKAFHYFCLSAENGNTISCETVGTFLIQGIGCKPDMKLATKYFQLGSNLKSPLCKYQLSIIYRIDDKQKSLQLLKESADLGFLMAQQEYVKYLLYTEKNEKEAEKYLRLAANQNDAESCLELSDLLKRSTNAIKRREAFLLLKKSAELGSSSAMLRMGKILCGQQDTSYGIEVEKDQNLALKYLKNAAEQKNDPEASIEYANFLSSIISSPSQSAYLDISKSEKECVKFYTKALELSEKLGSVDPRYVIALSDFYLSRGKNRESLSVLISYRKLYNPSISYRLAYIRYNENGKQLGMKLAYMKEAISALFKGSTINLDFLKNSIKKDTYDEKSYLNRLKIQVDKKPNDSESKLLLSIAYLSGIGMERDLEGGLKLMKQSAESGSKVAMKIYPAWMFFNVDGKKKKREELEEAIEICKNSADTFQDPDSQFLYGKLRVYGESEIELNPPEGVKYLKMAADLNNSNAAYLLGVLYSDGFLVNKDLEEAKNLLEKAKELGNKQADEALELLKHEQK